MSDGRTVPCCVRPMSFAKLSTLMRIDKCRKVAQDACQMASGKALPSGAWRRGRDVSQAHVEVLGPPAHIPVCDEIRHVVYMDGIWLVFDRAVAFVACVGNHVIGRYLVGFESSGSWGALCRGSQPPTRPYPYGIDRCSLHAFIPICLGISREGVRGDMMCSVLRLARAASGDWSCLWIHKR